MVELFRALGALIEPPSAEGEPLARAMELGDLPDASDHAELFLFQLPPFASIYLGAEGKLGGEARDRAAGFWRALGQLPPPEPDHLGALLSLYAGLREAAATAPDPPARALLERASGALLWEHILPWAPAYLGRVRDLAPPFYQRWSDVLRAALSRAAREMEEPADLPLHLREAPPLPDPTEAGGAAFLDGLLAPVRSGLILTRADLAHAAAGLGLGLRAGERRYALEALLGQDAPPVLAWLADLARAWVERHRQAGDVTGPDVADFWTGRATTTATTLDGMARESDPEAPCAP